MERIVEKPKNRLPYVILTLELVLAVLATIFFLAHGLDTDRFFVQVNVEACALIPCLSFPVYVGLEFVSMKINKEYEYEALPYAKEQHDVCVSVSTVVTVFGIIGGVVSMIVFQGAEAKIAIILLTMMSVPGMLIYLILSIRAILVTEGEEKQLLYLIGYLVLLVAIEIVTILLMYKQSPNYSMMLLGLPLLCIAMTMVGRSE